MSFTIYINSNINSNINILIEFITAISFMFLKNFIWIYSDKFTFSN